MELTDKTDQRLTDLEIKASFSEDLLDQLNQIIVRQQQEMADARGASAAPANARGFGLQHQPGQ
jgi:hypothetical protein